MRETRSVPPYEWGPMNHEQTRFYRRWKRNWDRGEAIDIEGQAGYIHAHMNQLAEVMSRETLLDELHRLNAVYGCSGNNPLTGCFADLHFWLERYDKALELYMSGRRDDDFFTRRIGDCLIMLGKHNDAIETFVQRIELGSSNQILINDIWSLKMFTGDRLRGQEVLSIRETRLTNFGKTNIDMIAERLDSLLATYEQKHNINLLQIWAEDSYTFMTHRVSGFKRSINTHIRRYDFSRCAGAMEFVGEITRLAENLVREDTGLPKVGEGWLSETELYYSIKQALPNYEVLQHHSPYWLGRQHFDIFIPKLRIALEYQGSQHDEPVEFFGGIEALEKTQQRDARKKLFSNKYGIQIIYVRPGYNLHDVLNEIREHSEKEIHVNNPTGTPNDYGTLPLFQFMEEKTTKTPSIADINDAVMEELLQIDANRILEPVRYAYELDPQFEIEPIKFDLSYQVSDKVVEKYYNLSEEIAEVYKQRDTNPDAIAMVIELCKEQIALGRDMAQYEYQYRMLTRKAYLRQAEDYEKDSDTQKFYRHSAEKVMSWPFDQDGYRRLAIIYEKQHRFKEALMCAVKAKSECWREISHKWDKRIVRLLTRLST